MEPPYGASPPSLTEGLNVDRRQDYTDVAAFNGPSQWSESVGQCRYPDNTHSNYDTLHDQPTVAACQAACDADSRCDAFDNNYPDFAGTCWLYTNTDGGQHFGNGNCVGLVKEDGTQGACAHCHIRNPGHGMEAFDHYNKYGAHSGTIWHSELCNSDGVPYKPPQAEAQTREAK